MTDPKSMSTGDLIHQARLVCSIYEPEWLAEQLASRLEALREAARRLANEAEADILAFPYLRNEIGNTNFNILKMRVDEMKEQLSR